MQQAAAAAEVCGGAEPFPHGIGDGVEVPPLPAARPQQITQAELQRLQQLRKFDQEYRDLRRSLLGRVTDKAPVEPGPLDLQIREVEQRSLSFGKLVEVGGREWAEQIRDRIAATRSLKLSVVGRPVPRATSDAAPRSARPDDYSSLM